MASTALLPAVFPTVSSAVGAKLPAVIANVPPLTVVAPVKELTPESVSVCAPSLVRLADPLRMPPSFRLPAVVAMLRALPTRATLLLIVCGLTLLTVMTGTTEFVPSEKELPLMV